MADTYKSFGTGLSGSTAITSIYAGVTGTAIVNSINISNIDDYYTGFITIDMLKGSTAYVIIKNATIPVGAAFQVLDAPMVLDSGNSLRATMGNTSGVNVIVSVLEIT